MRIALNKNKNAGLATAAIIFAIGALIHVLRLFTHFSVAIGGYEIPIAASALFVVILAALSFWMWTMRS